MAGTDPLSLLLVVVGLQLWRIKILHRKKNPEKKIFVLKLFYIIK